MLRECPKAAGGDTTGLSADRPDRDEPCDPFGAGHDPSGIGYESAHQPRSIEERAAH